MHNNAYLTYICTYIHIITHITHVVNTYKHNYMKIPHKFRHIRVNFLQSVRLQVTLGWISKAQHVIQLLHVNIVNSIVYCPVEV